MPESRQRLDKWLFFSRAVKSRTLAQKLIESGAVRVNSERTLSTDHRVGAGDVLTMTVHTRLLVWKILDPGQRRGPAPEAALLYEDLSPPALPRADRIPAVAERDAGAGRPTKKERRDTDRLKGE
ncbi:RNA-binding S4 domain-containing protein [Paradevosia shaoguanensis]|jgi:ribosome-associated heat shock protein Hsp15|uniref:RNA-binding S4 domain-containing protein n=1 Tax=Paradevosia shaoguanensis TaxID=1335043 RepID=UPI000455C73F|nr:RNA-binding S4 domain-containing protein [Paradevosia shaoguanensis]KFL26192.1 RNA-binding protein S4 [Devosia sp. 17-2-E-8]MBI4048609.1 RNA-binding S4 domain-containing protein [Devosia nanyangense]QMV00573.1 RNA-binding S4 domain-containing protein [Devosia sp. D6-9]CDP51842.1 Ribosome-associated heat shock protein implicated in the recycling of the 50S subunit (S4 paralog) [Devosia sp. DBB001]